MANKLDVWKVVTGAFLIPWRNRVTFAVALTNPVLLIASLQLSRYYINAYLPFTNWLSWGFGLLDILLYTMLAVTCHRLVILNLKNVTSFAALRWSSRETRFFFRIIFIGLIVNVLSAIGGFFLSIYYIAMMILPLYLFARICPIFPAIAVDKKASLKWAWNLSENNGWRLFFIYFVLPCIFSGPMFLLYRDNASLLETIILTILGSVLFVFEIAAISLSYYELTKNETR
jgi:hypothetical protein